MCCSVRVSGVETALRSCFRIACNVPEEKLIESAACGIAWHTEDCSAQRHAACCWCWSVGVRRPLARLTAHGDDAPAVRVQRCAVGTTLRHWRQAAALQAAVAARGRQLEAVVASKRARAALRRCATLPCFTPASWGVHSHRKHPVSAYQAPAAAGFSAALHNL